MCSQQYYQFLTEIANCQFQMPGTCSNFTTEQDCTNETPLLVGIDIFATNLGYNYTCLWNTTTNSCQRLTCGDFATEDECNTYSGEDYNYACNFSTLNTGAGGIDTCYNACPKLYEILFVIDASLSVLNADPVYRTVQKNVVLSITEVVSVLSELQNHITNETENFLHYCKFGLITFSGDNVDGHATVHFDLNNNFTSYEQYRNKISDVFNNLTYKDGTPTALAIEEAIHVLSNSPFDRNDPKLRSVTALITDGLANHPGTLASPCEESYNFVSRLAAFGTHLYELFVGEWDQSQFSCFVNNDDGLIVSNITFEDFNSLFSAISHSFNVFETEICRPPFMLPTAAPSFSPTLSPTDDPTPSPSDYPTPYPSAGPTETPTDYPTGAPTFAPTNHPTPNPSSFPSEIPSPFPTSRPTKVPTAGE